MSNLTASKLDGSKKWEKKQVPAHHCCLSDTCTYRTGVHYVPLTRVQNRTSKHTTSAFQDRSQPRSAMFSQPVEEQLSPVLGTNPTPRSRCAVLQPGSMSIAPNAGGQSVPERAKNARFPGTLKRKPYDQPASHQLRCECVSESGIGHQGAGTLHDMT